MSSDDGESPGLRSVKSTMRFLDVSKSTVFKLINEGKLDTVKVGKNGTRITQESLDRFITPKGDD